MKSRTKIINLQKIKDQAHKLPQFHFHFYYFYLEDRIATFTFVSVH